jgi:hypothetical protein
MKKLYSLLIISFFSQFYLIAQTDYVLTNSKLAEIKSKELLSIIDSIIDIEKNCYYYNDSSMFYISFSHFVNYTEIEIGTSENCIFDSLGFSFLYKSHLFQIVSDSSCLLDSGLYYVSKYKMLYNIDQKKMLKLAGTDDDTRSVFVYEIRDGVFIRKESYLCE